MTYFSTIYKLSLVAAVCFIQGKLERFANVLTQRSVFKYFNNSVTIVYTVDGSRCPVLECWFVQEKAGRGGGLTPAVNQEKSLLHVSTGAHSGSRQAPSDINPDKIYFVTGEFREPRQTEP